MENERKKRSRNENITLKPLTEDDREQFILDNQWAFKYGAMEEFGCRDDHFEEDGEIISRSTIEASIEMGSAYRIFDGEKKVGGAVVKVNGDKGALDLLFVKPKEHTKGIGYSAWCTIEEMYPDVKVWETHTPYFETRNIHFYVNRCGFHIVEFYNEFHKDSHQAEKPAPNEDKEEFHNDDVDMMDGMFRFEKVRADSSR